MRNTARDEEGARVLISALLRLLELSRCAFLQPLDCGSRLPQSRSSLNAGLAGGLGCGKASACRSSNSSSPKSPSSRNRCCARCCITCISSSRRRRMNRLRPRRHALGLARCPASSWPMILMRRSEPLPIIVQADWQENEGRRMDFILLPSFFCQ